MVPGAESTPETIWEVVEWALRLDGQDDFIDAFNYEPGFAGTIELWAKFSRVRNQVLLDATNEGNGQTFLLDIADSALRFEMRAGNDDVGEIATIDLNQDIFFDFENRWHHIGLTWQVDPANLQGTTQLFLDGRAEATGTTSQRPIKLLLQNLYLGLKRSEQATVEGYQAFAGAISQVRIWDHVRDSEALTNLRYAGLQGDEPGLQYFLPLLEGTGNELFHPPQALIARLKRRVAPAPAWVDVATPLFAFAEARAILPYTTTLGLTDTSFTVEAWVKLSDLNGEHPVLGTGGHIDNLAPDAWLFSISDGTPQVRLQGQADPELQASDLQLTPDTWHHVTWQYDVEAQSLRIFVDGKKSSDELADVQFAAERRRLYLGHQRHWNGSAWEHITLRGFVAEVRVWQGVRSETDLTTHLTRRLRGDEAGLTAYWAFNAEVLRFCDQSTNRFHRPLLAGTVSPSPDGIGPARPPILMPQPTAVLDGYNDYFDLNKAYIVDSLQWTVECWLNATDDDEKRVLFGKAGLYQARFANGCFRFEWLDNGQEQVAEVALKLELKQWYHLALVYDGSQLQCFVAGQPVATSRQPAVSLPDNQAVTFFAGAHPALHRHQFFRGRLAEVRLWQSARTQQEILDHYWHALTGREEQLAAYWPLTDDDTDRLYEQTDSFTAATLVTGFENPAIKWLPPPPSIEEALTALSLDGVDDHIHLPSPAALRLDHDFTVEAWIKIDDPSNDRPLAVVGSIAPQQANRDNQVLCLGHRAGKPYLSFFNNTLESPNALDEQWHFVSWHYELATETMRIFVDGVVVAEQNGRPAYTGAAIAYIGRWDDWDEAGQIYISHYFKGQIGEIRVWNNIREPEDITAKQNQRLVGNEENLLANWIFNDHNRTIIPSLIGTDNNLYHLVLQSDLRFMQPLWEPITDHPILRNPLSQRALSFDGRQQHLARSRLELPATGTLTLEAWVRLDPFDTQAVDPNQNRPIIWYGDDVQSGSTTNFVLRIVSGGLVEFAYWDSSAGALGRVASTATVPAGTFTHLAILVAYAAESKETTIQLVIDGDVAGTTAFTGMLRNTGTVLQVGREDTAGQRAYFTGLIQDVRLWQETKSLPDLNRNRYHTIALPDLEPGLVGYWPLTIIDEQGKVSLTPDLSLKQRDLILGGLVDQRKPLTTERGQALTLPPSEMPELLQIPYFNQTTYQNRLQRTIEIWFLTLNPYASKRQIVYQEGDDERGLSIYIQAGTLHFQGWNKPADESGWQETLITTDRIRANYWHHAAIVLNGREASQDDAFCAILDSNVIDTRPGSQLWGAQATTSIGGLTFEPIVDDEIALNISDGEVMGHWHQEPEGYWHDCNAAKGESQIQFVHADESGYYRIALRYPEDDPISPRFAGNVPIEIIHQGGTSSLTLDQRKGDGHDHTLGVFELEHNVSSVRISNAETGGFVTFEELVFIPLRYQQPNGGSGVETENWLSPDHLEGQIKQLRIWEAARTREQIEANADQGLPDDGRESLIVYWDLGQLNDETLRAAAIEVMIPNGLVRANPTIPLTALANIEALRSQFRLSVDKLTALWFTIKHTGLGDNHTLFDATFNPTGTAQADYWPYALRLRWDIESTDRAHQAIRARLMSALRVSSTDLNTLVHLIAPRSAVIILAGENLTHLYRLKLLSSMFRMSISDFARLIEILNIEAPAQKLPLISLATLGVADVMRIKARVAWLNKAGLDLSEYDFLVHNRASQPVSAPFTEANMVDMADTLLNQARDFLLTPTSLVSEEISDAASRVLYNRFRDRGEIIEIAIELPLEDGSGSTNITLGVILPNNTYISGDETIAPQDREQYAGDLETIAGMMNWRLTFQGLHISDQTLQNANLINDLGLVIAENPNDYSLEALTALVENEGRPVDRNKIMHVRDLIIRRELSQSQIFAALTARLTTMVQGLDATLLTAFSDLLETDPERLQSIISHTAGATYQEGSLQPHLLLPEINRVATRRVFEDDSDLGRDLHQLNKLLFLLSQFDLSEVEIEVLLAETLPVFGIEPAGLLNPTVADLTQLHTFVALKSALDDPGDRLIKVLLEGGDRLFEFTGWSKPEAEALAGRLNIEGDLNTLQAMDQLTKAFRLIRTLGANAAYVIDLAQCDNHDFAYFEKQAAILFDLARAKYNDDDEQWARVYKPIHNILAIEQRDSLIAVAMEQLATQLEGRKSPDLLYEYLLIDVRTGSEVDTSRIVQGIASLQLYVQRCMMNLEEGVKPEDIPFDEWAWMKNYRVWEANRKVFLYPENYIEPELRDTKTPLFKTLEEDLQQGDVNPETVGDAYTRYLDGFAAVANLKIVGSYLHKDVDKNGNVQGDVILFLVGRTDTQPRDYYYREYIVNKTQWLPWKRIELTINSDFVTPVFAFNKVFLFWSEFTKLTKSIDRKVRYYWAKIDKKWKRIPIRRQDGGNATDKEYHDVTKSTPTKEVDFAGAIVSLASGERAQENIDIYKPIVKYSYYNFSNTWIAPQTYRELENELKEDEYIRPEWQRVYAQRTEEFNDQPPERPPDEILRNVPVVAVSQDIELSQNIPDFDMRELTWSFWIQFDNVIGDSITGEVIEAPEFNLEDYRKTLNLIDYDDALKLRQQII
ncbi:MAG: LamG-like jellyroll fold domain-containing protein [Anaerolineae bacterium]|nr:LamG-like jellyroll fold domain-containing protein [Anaerolineae bacterium]